MYSLTDVKSFFENRLQAVVVFLLLIVMVSIDGLAQDKSTRRFDEISKLESTLENALLNADRERLNLLYDSDLQTINAAGVTSDKSQLLDYFTLRGVRVAVYSTDELKIRTNEKSAVVTGRLRYQYNHRVRDPNASEPDREVKWLRYIRVYEKRKLGWRIVAEQFTFIRVKE